jgi:hypothetical protein
MVADQPLPMRRAQYVEQCKRDVGSSNEDPIAEVFPDDGNGIVHLRLDSRSAGVFIYAVRLMLTEYSGQVQSIRAVAEDLPLNSYGARNRMEMITRKERVINRLLAMHIAYQTAIDKEWHGI